MANKKLYLSSDKKIGGVCGGIAEYLDADPTIIRIVYAFATIFTAFAGVLFYLLLWLILPSKN